MLDTYARPVAAPFFDKAAAPLLARNISATQITVLNMFVGLTGLFAVALGAYIPGLVFLLLNRFLDGVDGAAARATQITPFGAFFDNASRWMIHAGFVLFFSMSLADQSLASALLLFTYVAMIVLSVPQGRDDQPAFSFSRLIGETELIVFMVLCCLSPTSFAGIAVLFAVLCAITAMARLWNAAKILR